MLMLHARLSALRRTASSASTASAQSARWIHHSHIASTGYNDVAPGGQGQQRGEGKVRLAKLMAQKGLCSRREAEAYIQSGAVLVDGEKVKAEWLFVSEDADVRLDFPAQRHQRKKVTVLLNKPLGYVSSQPEDALVPAIKLLTTENECKDLNKARPRGERVEPIQLPKMAVCGRLDVNSTGLLIFTQDGTLAKAILDPNGGVEKEYLVRVNIKLDESSDDVQRKVRKLRSGVTSETDGITYKAKSVEILNENQLRFILTEGKNRHIRRMCEHVGIDVVALKRVRIGGIKLGNLPVGQWRYLQPTDRL